MIFKFTDNFIFFKKNPSILCRVQKMRYICIRNQAIRALSSAGSEHLVYTQRVGGSNPSAPTKEVQKNLFFILSTLIVFQKVCKFQFIYFCNRTVKNNLLWNLHLSK